MGVGDDVELTELSAAENRNVEALLFVGDTMESLLLCKEEVVERSESWRKETG